MMRSTTRLALYALLLTAAGVTQAQDATARAKALVARMTLPEKVAQLQNDAPAIPQLGVPAYNWWNEGLHGNARDGYATVFPQAIGLAASWDPALLKAVGTTVSVEARAKFNLIGVGKAHGRYQGLTIWSPNINIDRDPRWGRGQETYGEDPYLTGRLAVAYVQGIQGNDPGHPRAIATPKHFVAHSGPEPGRDSFDARVTPHDLEDTYLPAFRAAITAGGAGSVMCSYNELNGVPMCANAALLTTRLRKDWGFKGFVVSDCDAVGDISAYHHAQPDDTHAAAAALRAGTDLDCGNTYASLAAAVRQGIVPESALDTALVRLFAARYRLGELGGSRGPYAQLGADDIDNAAHRALALRAAQESLVLLKNAHDTLPLRPGLRIAVIGPDADTLETLEANYHGTARAPVTPLQGLRERFGADRVSYAQGAPVAAGVPVPVPETALRTASGAAGLVCAYYANADFRGTPVLTRTDRTIDFDWDRVAPAKGLDTGHYAVRWSGELLPPGPGDYVLVVHVDRCFDCTAHDVVRLFVDGKPVLADAGDGKDMQAKLHFSDTRPHALRLELVHRSRDQGVRLQWLAPATAQLAKAESAIRQADAVVAFVGLSPDVEGEALKLDVPGFDGGDRTDLALPAPQRALLERAAASGKPLVVVLMSGGAVALDWAKQHADAILAAWYPGQAGGTAIAQTLAGDVDPAGRLPVTFYRSVRDLPPFTDYTMAGRTYRYFRGTPLYPFGFGLSYTRFAYAAPRPSATTLKAGAALDVSAELRNTGTRAGDEVVQVYLDYPRSPTAPRHALVGFRRVHLAPGERQRVRFTLAARDLSSVAADGTRAVEPGRYRVFIGGGQPGDAAGVAVPFTIEGREVLAP